MTCPFATPPAAPSMGQSFWHAERPQPPVPTPQRLRRIQRLAAPQGGLVYAAAWQAWLVTGHQAASELLRSRQVVSTQLGEHEALGSAGLRLLRHMMLFQNGHDHRRLRGLVEQAFTPRMVAEQREHIQATLQDVMAQLKVRAAQGQPVDLVQELAHPFPTRVMMGMLGLNAADEERFLRWSGSMVQLVGGADPTPQLLAHIEQDAQQLRRYFGALADELRAKPRAGLLSGMAQAHGGQQLSSDELLANAMLLLAAGHEAVSNLIPEGLYQLSQQPEAWQALQREPEHPNVADELLRVVSPAQVDGRMVVQDLKLAGHTLRAGQFAQLLLGAANRDPSVFEQPDVINWQRPNSARHLAFAAGPHFCLGAALARLEIAAVFAAFARQFPHFSVLQAPQYKPNVLLRGPEQLWVRLEPDTDSG